MNKRIEKLCELLNDNQMAIITSKPNIFYYSGFTSDDAVLFISHDKQILVTDSRYTVQAREQAHDFVYRDVTEKWENIFADFKGYSFVYEEDNLSVGRFEKFKKYSKDADFKGGSMSINSPRMIKDKDEIEKIRAAEQLGDKAFEHILNFIKIGRTEKEVALELEFFMRKNGASGLSFETIVASGVRSSMPHGVASDKVIEKGDFVTMDFGCVLDGYCSDMTRTVVMGVCSKRQREIYDVVLKAQLAGIAAVKEGAVSAEVDKAARDIITEAGYGKNFGHALGHSVGLEIHESPVLSPRADGKLVNGNIVTVEPGIYIDGFGGVRIEDLVAVSGTKCDNFTNSIKNLLII